MGSRSKWEDMISGVVSSLTDSKSKDDTKKPDAPSLGSGMAENAKQSIMSYEERRKKALRDAGAE